MKKELIVAFLAIAMTSNAEEMKDYILQNDSIVTMLADNDSISSDECGQNQGKCKDKDDCWSGHVYVGVNIPTGTPSGVDFAPFRSWEIGMTLVQYDYTPKNCKTTFSIGAGLDWRNYTLSGHDMMFNKVNDVIVVGERESKMSNVSSRIHTMNIAMPLLVKQRFSKNFAVSLGAQLNWNVYSRVNNYYEMAEHEIKDATKDIGERPFTVDILGIVHLAKHFGIYCKYSPMSVLKKDKGPDFKSVAVGVYF